MKTVTNGFKEQIAKLGREIDFKFFLHTNDKIITENGKFLMTEDNMQLVVEQFDEEEIDEVITGEDIFNVSIINKGNILSTMMKEIDFEIKQDLRVGDIIGCQFGLKVNGNYEYVDYGKYMIYSKEFNEDTKTYNYVAFDRMLLTMQEASSDFLKTLEETTLASAISNICNQVGLSFTATTQELEDYSNLSKEINEGTFTDMEITYRDVLDMICQALGLSMIVEEKQLILKALNKTIVDSFDEQYLKDTNVSFGEKYMINSVVLSRSEDNDTIYRRDEQSIAENGVHEFKIKDNLIMLYDDREDYIDEIFNQLNGLEYYVNDFKSTGITYLDWLDFYNVTIGNKTYKCLMLNDEIKISQGLEENIYTEEPEETTTDYKTSSKTDKEVSFIVDKQRGSINAKVSKGDVINEINLDETGASINANKVNIQASDVLNILAGNSINLTSKDITINSTNFNVDKNGNITANNATLNSGTFKGALNTSQSCTVGDNLYVGQNQSASGADIKYLKMADDVYIKRILDTNYNDSTSEFHTGVLTRFFTKDNRGNDFDYFIADGNQITLRNDWSQYLTLDVGYIHASGDIVADSDKRLKQNIKDLDISFIDDLKVKKYQYKNSPDFEQIGLVAQDYLDKDYAKYFIVKHQNGYYGINYNNVNSALIQYCQEMKKEINSLKEEIKQLKESDK